MIPKISLTLQLSLNGALLFSVRRQYPPLSLLLLQRLIDLGRVNIKEPIDLTTLCNTKVIKVDTERNHYGINLTDEVKKSALFFFRSF